MNIATGILYLLYMCCMNKTLFIVGVFYFIVRQIKYILCFVFIISICNFS